MRKLFAVAASSLTLISASFAQAEDNIPHGLITGTVLETVNIKIPDAKIVFTDEQTVLYSPSTGLALKGEAFDYIKNVNLTQKVLESKQGTHNTMPSGSDKVNSLTVDTVASAPVNKKETPSDKAQGTPIIPKVNVDLSGAAEVQRLSRDVVNSLLPDDAKQIIPKPAAGDLGTPSAIAPDKKDISKGSSSSAPAAAETPSSSVVKNTGEMTKEEQFKHELVNLHENLLKDEATILYQSPNEKYRITVFTDITCPYCRRFHRDELPKLLDMGVSVRYLPYPRAGLESDTARQMAGIFCSSNQQHELMSIAKQGKSVPRENVECSPFFKLGYKIGQILQIPGTPTIFSQYGDFWPGLLKAEKIVEALEEHRVNK